MNHLMTNGLITKQVALQLLTNAAKLLSMAYVMGIVNCLADERALSQLSAEQQQQQLPDVGFDVVPLNLSLAWIVDSAAILQYVLVALHCLWTRRLYVLALFFEMHAAILVLRCLLVASTVLPSPLACTNRDLVLQEQEWSLLLRPMLHFMQSGSMLSWCHDFMFSGHTAALVLATLTHFELGSSLLWTITALLLTVSGIYVLLATRAHYTIDIVVACIVVPLLFQLYKPRLQTRPTQVPLKVAV